MSLRDKVTAGIGELYAQQADELWWWFETKKKFTESPIETAFLIALHGFATWGQHAVFVSIKDEIPSVDHSHDNEEDWIHIFPQTKIGDYRVDFLITFNCGEGEESFIVECDGHDFHDRTPFQASRDRERDRTLLMAGHKVFRFTGRDINRRVMDCVNDLMEFMGSRRTIADDPELRGKF